jgi:transmembrane sensor
MSARETADEIEEAAARWVFRLDREGRRPETQAELESWLVADPRRRGAFLQAEAAWAMLDPTCDLETASVASGRPRSIGRRGFLVGAGAAIAASVAGGFWLANPGDRYRTAVGEIRRVPLKDGSVAAINTDSRMAVALADTARTVAVDQGEVWFQVAKDPARPFTVEAGPIRVRAVGTAFSVRRRIDGADVLVTEGVVEAWSEVEKQTVRLTAGERAFVAARAKAIVVPPAPSEVDRKLAWRSGKIDLAGETLASAAEEFNRYNSRRIEVAPRLATEQFFGVFRTDDPEGFARAVKVSLGAALELSDPAKIVIG